MFEEQHTALGDVMTENRYGIATVRIPPYSEAAQLLRTWEGVSKQLVSGMIRMIADQIGTARKPVDWSDPDSWIARRLPGEYGALARRIWQESGNSINPRYVYDAFLFIMNKRLLDINIFGRYQLTALGLAFTENDEKTLADLDQSEGLSRLLTILAGMDAVKRGDLIQLWRDFLREYSQFASQASVTESLRSRLVNLLDRDYVSRDGVRYAITKKGVDYAARFISSGTEQKREAIRAVQAFNNLQKKALRARLAVMRLQRFEHLLRELLAAMGYEEIEVVRDSGEKGITFTAAIRLGIAAGREVIRVNRQENKVGSPALERLRELLPALQACRATYITTGRFARNCPQAAVQAGRVPVALIDGGGLVNLLFEHRIGLTDQPLLLYQVDEEYFR
jgi:restriction system protein